MKGVSDFGVWVRRQTGGWAGYASCSLQADGILLFDMLSSAFVPALAPGCASRTEITNHP